MSYRDDLKQFERERYLETVGEVERLKGVSARAEPRIAVEHSDECFALTNCSPSRSNACHGVSVYSCPSSSICTPPLTSLPATSA